MLTFNKRLTAIGGHDRRDRGWTRKVEVYDGESWNDNRIPPVGIKDGRIFEFTSLAIENQLYVFGNISVLNQKVVLKLNYFLLRRKKRLLQRDFHRLEV